MKIESIRISREVAQKIRRKHHIMRQEVKEIFFNPYEKPIIRRSPRGRARYAALGRTEAGRYLAVIFVRRKESGINVITARDMDNSERRLYQRERR